VKFSKEILGLQVKIDAIEEMNMCMLVKQLGANKQGQVIMVLRTFLDFMFSFKSIKTHNMVALILDPQFKNLNLAVDYVGHSFAIKIVATCDK
jgi:hypothetical protein